MFNTNKEYANTLFKGTIISIVSDTDMDEVISIWINGENNIQYEVIYREALYSELDRECLGLFVLAKEISLEKLKSPEHAAAWEKYQNERRDPEGTALAETDMHKARRLFIHVLNEGTEALVVASEVEIIHLQP